MTTARPTRRRGRTGRVLLVAGLFLAAALAIADRVSLAVAERAAAVTLQQSQHLDQRPDVSVGGFPFLTQLATGTFDRIDVTAHDVPLPQTDPELRLAQLDVTLRHVHVSRDFNSARSESSTATALIAYPDLSSVVGTTVRYAGGGRIRAAANADVVPGLSVPASATASVGVRGELVTFGDPQISIGGQTIPPALSDYFTSLFAKSIPLTGLPFGVHVTSVSAGTDGIAITLVAGELTFRR